MAVMYSGGAAQLRRVLGSRVGLRLGLFSYSIYLLHGPLLAVVDVKILRPLHVSSLLTFSLLLFVAVPVVLVICYGFHLMFEAPFVAHRDFSALRAMPGVEGLLARRRTIVPRAANAPSTEIVAPQESVSS
jgi:peptidoglycan/LPS O-acetylase OafA/YrhL